MNGKPRKNGDCSVGRGDANDSASGAKSVELPGRGQRACESRRLQNELIAIVDDEACMRRGLRALVESRGYRAATFASAEDYVTSGVSKNTACLVLDVHLPGMDGPALQARLIADGCCPPTVFVTGRFEQHVQKRVIAAGAVGYLTKPCNEKELFERIAQALAARRHRGGLQLERQDP